MTTTQIHTQHDMEAIAASANTEYGWNYDVKDFALASKWDFLGRQMVYCGSIYVGAIEKDGSLVLNRQARA